MEDEVAELRAEVERLKRTTRSSDRFMLVFMTMLTITLLATNFFTNRSLDLLSETMHSNAILSVDIDGRLINAVNENTTNIKSITDVLTDHKQSIESNNEGLYFAQEALTKHDTTISDMQEQLSIMYDIIWNLNQPPDDGG